MVTYVSTAEGFLELSEGDYVISKDNLQDEVQVGDTVEIWTNGSWRLPSNVLEVAGNGRWLNCCFVC